MSENRTDVYRVYDARGLGHAIRYFRQEAGLTQAELAERTGIPRPYLVHIEQGHETEHLRKLFRILRNLDLDLSVERRDY
jgi:transcriptional regulator with XRE-family HTH domain